MKKLLIAALVAMSAPVAMAQSATVNNTANIGVQSNTQTGAHNTAVNEAAIVQDGVAIAFDAYGTPTHANVNNTGNIGAQLNFQDGKYNTAANSALIAQTGVAEAFGDDYGYGPSRAAVNNAGNIGVQDNTQLGHGYANTGVNAAEILQSGVSISEGLSDYRR